MKKNIIKEKLKDIKITLFIILFLIILPLLFIGYHVSNIIQYYDIYSKGNNRCDGYVSNIVTKSGKKFISYEVYVSYNIDYETYNEQLGNFSLYKKFRVGNKIDIYYNPNYHGEITSKEVLYESIYNLIFMFLIALFVALAILVHKIFNNEKLFLKLIYFAVFFVLIYVFHGIGLFYFVIGIICSSLLFVIFFFYEDIKFYFQRRTLLKEGKNKKINKSRNKKNRRNL